MIFNFLISLNGKDSCESIKIRFLEQISFIMHPRPVGLLDMRLLTINLQVSGESGHILNKYAFREIMNTFWKIKNKIDNRSKVCTEHWRLPSLNIQHKLTNIGNILCTYALTTVQVKHLRCPNFPLTCEVYLSEINQEPCLWLVTKSLARKANVRVCSTYIGLCFVLINFVVDYCSNGMDLNMKTCQCCQNFSSLLAIIRSGTIAAGLQTNNEKWNHIMKNILCKTKISKFDWSNENWN